MSINPFLLERYFAKYEFNVKYLLSPSDCESYTMQELLQTARPEILELWNNLKLSYTDSRGHELLRSEISELYRRISSKNILVAAPEECIYIAMQTLLQKGDEIIFLAPAYQSLYEVARSKGCAAIPWPIEKSNSTWRLDVGKLDQLISAKTKMLVINFPHNPTGCIPSLNELNQIIEIARRANIFIFSDEMYHGLEYDPSAQLPPAADLYEKGISFSGLSKSFALPGLRIGWLASQNQELIKKLLGYKDYTTICSSAPGEILAIVALQNKKSILIRNNEIVAFNKKTALDFFSAHADKFLWFEPQGGSTAFPEWTGKKSIEDLCGDLLIKKEVMIVPGSLFDFRGNHFRIGLGRKNFSEGLEQFGEYLISG